jgi:hypothetical protein
MKEVDHMEILNQVRGYSYIAGVLKNREGDPYCGACSAFANTLTTVREGLAKLEQEHAMELEKVPSEFSIFLSVAGSGIKGMRNPVNSVGQKKAGNCTLPEGVCFVKASLATLQKI